MDVVDRIFELLDSTTMEQQEFARRVGVSDDTASNWRRRRSASYTRYLPKIAEVLHTSTTYLLEGIRPEAAQGGVKSTPSDAELQAAFWGGDADLPPEELAEMWADVKEYARYKMEQRKKKKND